MKDTFGLVKDAFSFCQAKFFDLLLENALIVPPHFCTAMNRSEPILDDEYYHVYNRGNRR